MASSTANLQIPKGIVSFRKFTSLPKLWTTGMVATPDSYCITNYGLSGELYYTVSGGTATGTGAGPTGTGASITDGGITWSYVDWTDLGEAPKVDWSAETETKDYFSNRSGTRERVLQVLLSKQGNLSITLNEITVENLSIGLLGTVTGATGSREINVFANEQTMGQLWIQGTNDVGNLFDAHFGYVRFLPGKTFPFIADDWAGLECDIQVNKDPALRFATIYEE